MCAFCAHSADTVTHRVLSESHFSLTHTGALILCTARSRGQVATPCRSREVAVGLDSLMVGHTGQSTQSAGCHDSIGIGLLS